MESDERINNARDSQLPNGEERTTDEADLLYSRGMAHYRRRQWREARDCFVRLKAIQSERRGIDALLGELNIFIQLEEIQPERREPAPGRPAETAEEEEEPGMEYAPLPARRRRVWPGVLVALVLLAVAVFAVLYTEGMLPFVRDARRQDWLRNQGQAYLLAGIYRGAILVFEELLTIVPGDREAEVGLAKAYYGRGLELVDAAAGANLDQVAQAIVFFDKADRLNPSDGRPAAERDLAETYLEGCNLFDQGYWEKAVAALSVPCRARPDYAGGRAAQLLCQAHLNMARMHEEAGDLESALQGYQVILSLSICEGDEAVKRVTEIAAALTPTVTPTSTSTPTHTPRPTATATRTVVIPTATSTPSPMNTPPPPTPTTKQPAKSPKPSATPVATGRPR